MVLNQIIWNPFVWWFHQRALLAGSLNIYCILYRLDKITQSSFSSNISFLTYFSFRSPTDGTCQFWCFLISRYLGTFVYSVSCVRESVGKSLGQGIFNSQDCACCAFRSSCRSPTSLSRDDPLKSCCTMKSLLSLRMLSVSESVLWGESCNAQTNTILNKKNNSLAI